MDYSILGSILGFPNFGKLPFRVDGLRFRVEGFSGLRFTVSEFRV